MRILYGVHGYSRGHATRAAAVLSSLSRRHEVLILAGGDAYALLRSSFDVESIPSLAFAYGRSGRISMPSTLRRNAPKLADMLLRGETFQRLAARVRAFRPDVVVSDAEPWTHRLAWALGVPRVGFDHFGIMVHCDVSMSLRDRVTSTFDRAAYRVLMGRPERVLVSSFFSAPARTPGARVVGPLLRPEVHEVQPSIGEHMLVYLNNGMHQLTASLHDTLRRCGSPLRVYGTARVGVEGLLTYRPPSSRGFLEDLASARAVISTAGNQLVGEALHYGKPILVLPEDTVEQRMNARAVVEMGVGEARALTTLSVEDVQGFVARAPHYAEAATACRIDGKDEALRLLEAWIEDLPTRAVAQRSWLAEVLA